MQVEYDFLGYEGPEEMLCTRCEQVKECVNPRWAFAGYLFGKSVSAWDGDNAICMDCLLALPYLPIGQVESPIFHEHHE